MRRQLPFANQEEGPHQRPDCAGALTLDLQDSEPKEMVLPGKRSAILYEKSSQEL